MRRPSIPRFDETDYQGAITIRDRLLPLINRDGQELGGTLRYTCASYNFLLRRQKANWHLELWRGNTLLMCFEWSDDDGHRELKRFNKPANWLKECCSSDFPKLRRVPLAASCAA
jgi:hypothetical protein